MNARKRLILQPEYVKNFVCDGITCEDNCCQGYWGIPVDEEHYKKIKKIQDKDLKDKVKKYIRRNRTNPTKESYGKIHQDKELNQCIFLTEDKLCEIQGKLGADYLCNTCMVYPRDMSSIDGKYERSLTMSCPIAAKQALLNPELMAFEQFEEVAETRMMINSGRLDTQNHLFPNKPQKHFWDIRIFSISLLQNRNYPLGDRLIILGIIYKKIEELSENKRVAEIPSMLDNMAELIETGFFKGELEKVTPNVQIQIQMTKAMVDRKIHRGIISERYLECFKDTLMGLGYVEEVELEEVIENYAKNYKGYYAPYIEEKEYILENYLVNEYFRQMMPFGRYENIWDSYVFLCVLYSMTKLHLIGMAGYHRQLNDDLTLKLIQSLSKEVIHNIKYTSGVIQVIKDSGYDSLAYMSILLKN